MNQNSQTMSSSAAADEAAIRALYQQVIDGGNAGSGDAFADKVAILPFHIEEFFEDGQRYLEISKNKFALRLRNEQKIRDKK